MSRTFEITVQATLENLSVIGGFVVDAMRQMGADDRSIFEVELVVDEACTNIVQYAYGDEGGTISLTCRQSGDDLIVSIVDRGKPFDPKSVALPDVGADLAHRKIGGLGVFFMHRMMDQVDYSYDPEVGNRLTMKKRLAQT